MKASNGWSILVFLSAAICAEAQTARYIIHFTDKHGGSYSLSRPGEFLSEKCIERRVKQGLGFDSTDLPVISAYTDSLLLLPGVSLLNKSRWMNQVLIRCSDSSSLQKIRSFSFVAGADSVAPQRYTQLGRVQTNSFTETIYSPTRGVATNSTQRNLVYAQAVVDYYNYGNTYAQIHIHNGEYLHNNGYHGEGMTIAILDAGFFGYLTNPAFDSLRSQNGVLGTFDFVNVKNSVNEEDPHGGYCLSALAANEQGTVVGSAPKASFWLFKTEDVNSETLTEEQNWVAAAEFADSAGADMISTSLGYINFDLAADNHSYTDRNGHTALITKAANLAVAKGMIVTASAGNNGTYADENRFISCPADGDSVLAVGAVDINGNIASFSSWGPNSSGQVKPDVVSVGLATVLAAPDGSAVSGNGTSYANPNLAGLVACLWQAFPAASNHDIMEAVKKSSSIYSGPDVRLGYGIPDFEKAFSMLQGIQNAFNTLSGEHWISAYPVPYKNNFSVILKAPHSGRAILQLINTTGSIVEEKTFSVSAGQFIQAQFSVASLLASGVYFIRFADGQQTKTIRVIRL